MSSMTARTRNERGTSFLEVIIALSMMGVVTTAILGLYVTQHKHYITQEDITLIQQNGRSSIDEVARNIRMAGHQLPTGVPALAAANTNPDTITITYSAVDCDTYLTGNMASPSEDLHCATAVSCFKDGEWVYIYEPDSGGGEWFQISQVVTASNDLRHSTDPLSKAYRKDAIIVTLEQVKFFINATTDAGHPNLMMQQIGQVPQVFAENVNDLQFRYRMKNGQIVDVPVIIDNVREVLISVSARSAEPDLDGQGHQTYRNRTFSSAVYLRNIES